MFVAPSIKGCFSAIASLFGTLIIIVGYFVDIPIWLVYGAGVITMLAIIFIIGSNIAQQIIRKRAGKSFFPKTSDKLRFLRIIQAITLFALSDMRFTLPPSLEPTFASKYASNDVQGILLIFVGIMLLTIVQHVHPQIVEHGVFDVKGNFHPWSAIESFAWYSYASRLIFKLKGDVYQKVMIDNIPLETHREIYPYLERHLHDVQNTSQ